jgi:hypothetical protein
MTIGHWTNWTTGGNALAKDYLAITKTQPRCYEVPYEPWSIWHKGKKTVQPSNTIYKIIHREEAIKYWERKDKVILELLGNVSWEAIGGAMQTSGCPRQHFVIKHTVGMCGMGKNMKRWKHSSTILVLDPEDTEHVWQCKGENAKDVWTQTLHNLQHWLDQSCTSPVIMEAIISSLRHWRTGSVDTMTYSWPIRNAIGQQNNIGWP